jgi:hypothetical protein
MRRILLSKRGEFNYQSDQATSLGYAIKKLGTFFDGVEKKEPTKIKVAVSNGTLTSVARKARSG